MIYFGICVRQRHKVKTQILNVRHLCFLFRLAIVVKMLTRHGEKRRYIMYDTWIQYI